MLTIVPFHFHEMKRLDFTTTAMAIYIVDVIGIALVECLAPHTDKLLPRMQSAKVGSKQ